MRTIGVILIALLLIGLFVTLGATGILDMIHTGWTTITTGGTTA